MLLVRFLGNELDCNENKILQCWELIISVPIPNTTTKVHIRPSSHNNSISVEYVNKTKGKNKYEVVVSNPRIIQVVEPILVIDPLKKANISMILLKMDISQAKEYVYIYDEGCTRPTDTIELIFE